MPSAPEDQRTVETSPGWEDVPTAARRVGHLLLATVHAVLLWLAHQLLDWDWPGFLTDEFAEVLGVVSASLVANVLVNLALVIHQGARFTALTELITTWFGLAVSLRLLDVFPFDFTGYAIDWSGAAHALLILLVAVTGVAMVVHLVRLIAGPDVA